jgi:aspartyl-tRNA(Asn)/glutamyl-tRNA(Gln) amidotransferase subunit C
VSLERSDVEKIAQLAAIRVGEGELEAVGDKLSKILDVFDLLAKANTDGVEPMAHPLDQVQRLREDSVTETDQRDIFQAVAPATENGLYLVPKVIE